MKSSQPDPLGEPSSSAQKPSSLLGLLGVVAVVFGALILSKFNAPHEDSSETVHPQDTPEKECGNGYNEPPIVLNVPPSHKYGHHPYKCQCNVDKKTGKKIANGAVAIATSGLLVIAIFTLYLTERPWVGLKRVDGDIHIGADEPLSIDITFINSGRAPALNLHSAKETDCEPVGVRPTIGYTEQDSFKYGYFVVVPEQEFHGTFEDVNSKNVCSAENMELLRNKKASFYVLGTLWYSDTFGIKHHTDFCHFMEPRFSGFRPCGFHNDAD